DVLGDRGRVDGGGGRSGAHDRQVGEDPLVAGAGGDADPLLGLDPERQQAGRELVDVLAGLAPRHRLPGVPDRVAEGLAVGGLAYPFDELHGHVGWTVLDHCEVVLDGTHVSLLRLPGWTWPVHRDAFDVSNVTGWTGG